MGLFTSLFSSKAPERQPVRRDLAILVGPGNFELEIVGEEQHQAALEALCGPRLPRSINRFETAFLLLEDNNPRDKNAVRVEIRRKPVGYLGREAAIRYRRQLMARGTPQANGQCQALISGGWLSSDGRKGPYEVWLDLPASEQ